MKAENTVPSFVGKRTAANTMDKIATGFLWLAAAFVMCLVGWLLFRILGRGIPKLTWGFFFDLPEEIDAGGGIGPMLFNSFYVLILSLVVSLPVGIGAGIYLAEYAPDNWFTGLVRICVEALASVPSMVFGLLGLAIFVEYFGIGLTIIGGAVSLALLNLPILTRVTEEAVRAVPQELRSAAYALGTTKFQTIRTIVIPAALNGIVTGICLTAGRAYGESAVILLTAGSSTSGRMWDFHLFSPGETLAVHLWYVQAEAIVPDAREIADKASAVLILVVLLINVLFRLPLWFRKDGAHR